MLQNSEDTTPSKPFLCWRNPDEAVLRQLAARENTDKRCKWGKQRDALITFSVRYWAEHGREQ